ncbi:MAG: hypothetical protein IID46_00170 [Planctomycetes bacterium]|nr:hypothetical protein [Planctomycetota bacterium]
MGRSIYTVCVATCFIATAVMAQQPVSAPSKSSKKVKAGESIQRVLNAKSPNDFREAVKQLVGKASKKQLREYKTHSHNSIALHAAWEEAKRSTTISRAQLSKLENGAAVSSITINMNRPALQQFISFMEGRLRVTPPNWWRTKVRRARTYWNIDDELSFPRIDSWFIEDKRVLPYSKYKGQVSTLSEIDLTNLTDGRLKVTSEKLSCTIPARYLEAAKKRFSEKNQTTWPDLLGLTAWMDDKHCIFGFHYWLPDGFTLHCIDRKTTKHIWSTEVRGYGYFGGFSGAATLRHWVEIRRRGDKLFLFGIKQTWGGKAYIEGHSMKDGTNLFHFTTSYHADPSKEEE